MEENLQHDPRTKQVLKDTLYQYLYGPVQKQFKLRLDAIITKNSIMIGATHNSFIYKNMVYSCDGGVPPRKMNRLIQVLHQPMDEYIKDLNQLNNTELPYVLGFLTHVLNSSNDLHDYLRVFPQAIHQPIQEYINSCPCRTKHLTDFDVDCIQQKNHSSIELIKKRMVTNLLI